MGLIGRANKQIFFDAGDKADPSARAALEQAIAAYRIPFEASPSEEHLAWRQSGGAPRPRAASRSADCSRPLSRSVSRSASSLSLRSKARGAARSGLVSAYARRSVPRSWRLGRCGAERQRLRSLGQGPALSNREHAAAIHASVGYRDAGRARAGSRCDPARATSAAQGRRRSAPRPRRFVNGALSRRRRPGSSRLFSARKELRLISGGEPVLSAPYRSARFARNSANASAVGSC